MFVTTKYFKKEGVAKIILNGPRYNALSRKLLSQLIAALKEVESQYPKYGAVILTGTDKAFSAGASIDEFVGGEDFLDHYDKTSTFFRERLPAYPIPIVAAVNGFCFGGGLELALSCDIILASTQAKMGLPELTLGLIPGFGGTQRLSHRIGKYKASELIFTSRSISASEAHDLKLVNEVIEHDKLADSAFGLASKISSGSRAANRAAKLSIAASLEHLKEGARVEAEHFKDLLQHGDVIEGVDAFLHKRKPQFKL